MKLGKIVFAGVVTVGVLVISDLKDRINKLEAEAKEDQKEIDDLREHSWWDVKRAEQAEDAASNLYDSKNMDIVSNRVPTDKPVWNGKNGFASEMKEIPGAQEFYSDLIEGAEEEEKETQEMKTLETNGESETPWDVVTYSDAMDREDADSLYNARAIIDTGWLL